MESVESVVEAIRAQTVIGGIGGGGGKGEQNGEQNGEQLCFCAAWIKGAVWQSGAEWDEREEKQS